MSDKYERAMAAHLKQQMDGMFEEMMNEALYNGMKPGPTFYGADWGHGQDHSAFVKMHMGEDGKAHVDQVDVYEPPVPDFPRTLGRSIFEDARLRVANVTVDCPLCNDGLRYSGKHRRWEVCVHCDGFGLKS